MADKDDGKWITIGAVEGDDGRKHGGSPIFVQGGRVVRGAPGLVGRKIDSLKEPAESSSHRRELNQSRDYDRAIWAKKAREQGIEPTHLHTLANELMVHDREHVEARKKLLRDARDYLKREGYDPRFLTQNLRSGKVEDKIPKLDELHDMISKAYPEQFAGHADHEARMLSLLTEGNPEGVDSFSAYQTALDHLMEMGAHKGDDSTSPADERPWDEDEPEPDPWGFTQPQNTEPIPPSPRHPRQIEAAWQRFRDRDQTARGGGLFGSEDLQGRRGFSRLPDGSGILITGGKYAGATARIVHDSGRIVAEIDGAPYLGLIPVDYSTVEPLTGAQSWRTEAAAAPSEQRSLLSADAFLPPRRRQSEDDSVPFSRTHEGDNMRSTWDTLTSTERGQRLERVSIHFARMNGDGLDPATFDQADRLDTLLSGADPDQAEQRLEDTRQAVQRGAMTFDDAVQQLSQLLGGAPTGTPDPNVRQRLERLVRRALTTGSSLAACASEEPNQDEQQSPRSQQQPLAFARREQSLQQWRHRFNR